MSLHHAEHHRGADRRVPASPGLHRPAGDGSLGPLALAAALAAVAGAVVPFIVAHLIALAVITAVTVAGTAGIVQWMKRFSVAVIPERIQEHRPILRVYGRALPGRRPARALPAPQPRVTGAQKVIQGTVATMAAGNQQDATCRVPRVGLCL